MIYQTIDIHLRKFTSAKSELHSLKLNFDEQTINFRHKVQQHIKQRTVHKITFISRLSLIDLSLISSTETLDSIQRKIKSTLHEKKFSSVVSNIS